jgi:hypothetical protein
MPRNQITRVLHTCLLISLISIAIGLCTYHSSASNTADPVTKLTGEFVVADSVGSNHLLLAGGAALVPGGKIGSAFSFDGISGYAKAGSQIYSLSGGTVSLWFTSREQQPGTNVITGSFDDGDRRTPTFFLDNGDLRWEFANVYFQPALTHITQDQWYHVAMTYDSSFNVKVYVNGVLAGQGQASDPGGFPEMFAIGAYGSPSGAGQFFNGLVDEVSVYSRPLSAAEIDATYHGQEITPGLLSWFRGNLAAKDCLVAGSCTLENGVTSASGVFNDAFKFDGIDDQIVVPDSTALSSINTAMSIRAWIRTTDSNTAPRIATKLNPGSPGGFDLHLSSGKLQMNVSDAQSQVTATSANSVNDGNWHYVAGVYDGNRLSLYIDGDLDVQVSGSITIAANNGQPLTVGAWQGAFPYAGLIDELEIYDRALSGVEVNDGYGPVSKWSGDGDAEDSITDNDFTLLGEATFDSAGKVGQAFSFDGATGYGKTSSPTYSLSGGTVALWFKSKDSQPSGYGVITGSYGGGDGRTPTFFLNNGDLQWEFGTVYYQPVLTHVLHDQWYHVAMTYDSDLNVKVYLNGALAAQGTSTNPGEFPPYAGIGAYPDAGGVSQFFNGLIDEIVIYKRPLAAEEIRAMVPNAETAAGTNVTTQVGQTLLTFADVTTTGITTVTPIDPASVGQVAGGFAISDSVAYEISTTATFTGSVTLAFKVPGPIAEQDFNSLAILHNVNGTLVDVTASTPPRDYAGLTIYATTTSFSPFYLARRGTHIKTLFDQTRAYKRGSTIPLKLQLQNASNVNVSSANTSLVTRDLRLMSGNTLASIEDSGNSNPDYTFRYDSTLGGSGDGYIFNLSTKGLAPGQYVLSFYVGSERSFFYTVKFEVK